MRDVLRMFWQGAAQRILSSLLIDRRGITTIHPRRGGWFLDRLQSIIRISANPQTSPQSAGTLQQYPVKQHPEQNTPVLLA
jgi:hypothetical protein